MIEQDLVEAEYSSDGADAIGNSDTDDDTEKCNSTMKYNHHSRLTKLNCKNIPKLDSYKCKHCCEKFEKHKELVQHNKSAHELEKPYECVICDKSFRFRTDLRRHELIHLNQRSFQCELCDRSYNTRSLLNNHKTCMHTDRTAWKYACPHCELRFPNKSNLDKHVQRKHTNASDEWICYDCNKKCDSKVALCLHIRNYHTLKRLTKKCPKCEKTYINQTVLESHMRKAHGIGDTRLNYRSKRFECEKCGKMYTTEKVMKVHAKDCDGIKRHNKPKEGVIKSEGVKEVEQNCKVCDATFESYDLLSQHVREEHAEQTSESTILPVASTSEAKQKRGTYVTLKVL